MLHYFITKNIKKARINKGEWAGIPKTKEGREGLRRKWYNRFEDQMYEVVRNLKGRRRKVVQA